METGPCRRDGVEEVELVLFWEEGDLETETEEGRTLKEAEVRVT